MAQVNELPQGWKWVRLGDVAKQDRLIVEPYSELSNNLPYLGLEHIESNSGKILKDIQEKIEDEGKSTTFYFNENHILYGKLRPYLNKVALPDFEGRCTTELMPFLPKDNISREFIAWILKRDETISFVMQEATGSRMPRADIDKLLNLIIPLPPFPEQQRLATLLTAKLSLIEQAKEKITAQLQAAQELTAAYLREVFESEEAKGWELVKFQDICQINPTRKPIKRKDDELTSFIPMAAIDARLGKIDKLEEQPFIKVKKGYTYFEENDVLFAKITPCMENGKQAIAKNLIDGFGFGTTEFHVIRPNEKIISEWIYFLVRRKDFLEEAAKNFTGSVGQQRVPKEFLENSEIPLPPPDKQKQLANYLSEKLATVEQLKTTLQTQLDSINQLPAALLKQAFSGEL